MPGSKGDAFAVSDAASMPAVTVDKQIRGNIYLKERVVEVHRLFRMELVVAACAGEERRSGVFRSGDVHRRPARVHQAHKVGTAALPVDWVGGVGVAAIKPNIGQRGQRSSCGEAQNTDAIRFDAPLRGTRADEAQG